jgi:hypothetical protein
MRPVARAWRECMSRPYSIERRFAALSGAAILVAAFACGDPYTHTNPYDPLVPVTLNVTGPDTIFSYSETGQYNAQSVPAFPDSSFQFATSDSIAFPASGRGTFVSRTPPLYPATQTVRVMAMLGQIDTVRDDTPLDRPVVVALPSLAWRHSGAKNVVLTQRVVHIQLRCPADHACDTLSAGAVWTVWADGFDALNFRVVALTGVNANPAVSAATPVFATFAARDTTIASVAPVGIRAATVTARKPGTTWIVATRGSLLDSLALVVK